MWKQKHAKLDELVQKLPNGLLILYSVHFTLELVNNTIVGEQWSWLMAISLVLTTFLIMYQYMRKEELTPENMKYMTGCNGWLMLLTLCIIFGAFHKDTVKPPEWAQNMPNPRIGSTWL